MSSGPQGEHGWSRLVAIDVHNVRACRVLHLSVRALVRAVTIRNAVWRTTVFAGVRDHEA